MNSFTCFLEKLENLLKTGNVPNQEYCVPFKTHRLALAANLFSRELYKNLGKVTLGQYDHFYSLFLETLLQISPSDFEHELSSLDAVSKENLLQTLGDLLQNRPELDLTTYTRFL